MRSRAPVWWAVAVSAATTTALVSTGVLVLSPQPGAEVAQQLAARGPAVGTHALAVLRRWDRRRAGAWAAGDPAALARLYVGGSHTGRHDVSDLARWQARGLRVVGLHQQVAALSLRRRTPGHLTVVVTDRTVDGVAVGGRHRLGVPRSAWAVHRVTLRRVAGRWRVVEARAQPAR
jgi:hypothetical protein